MNDNDVNEIWIISFKIFFLIISFLQLIYISVFSIHLLHFKIKQIYFHLFRFIFFLFKLKFNWQLNCFVLID